MWSELLKENVRDFFTRPQTRRQQHLTMFELLEEGDVSTGVLAQWDGKSSLRLCEDCYTLNQATYHLCRRCTGRLRYHPRLDAHQIVSHLDAAEDCSR